MKLPHLVYHAPCTGHRAAQNHRSASPNQKSRKPEQVENTLNLAHSRRLHLEAISEARIETHILCLVDTRNYSHEQVLHRECLREKLELLHTHQVICHHPHTKCISR
jgi:hypothetical protein